MISYCSQSCIKLYKVYNQENKFIRETEVFLIKSSTNESNGVSESSRERKTLDSKDRISESTMDNKINTIYKLIKTDEERDDRKRFN